MKNNGFKISQYACAVLLITSSIALVTYQVVEINDVAGGLLYYVAQSFLLAGSIFGLDQYIKILKKMKAAIEREQSQTCLSYVEREQARCAASRIEELKLWKSNSLYTLLWKNS